MYATKAEAILALKEFIKTCDIKCTKLSVHNFFKEEEQGYVMLEFKCDKTPIGKYEQFVVHKDEHGIYGEW